MITLKKTRNLLMAVSAVAVMSSPALAQQQDICLDRVQEVENRIDNITSSLEEQLDLAREAADNDRQAECLERVSSLQREVNDLEIQQRAHAGEQTQTMGEADIRYQNGQAQTMTQTETDTRTGADTQVLGRADTGADTEGELDMGMDQEGDIWGETETDAQIGAVDEGWGDEEVLGEAMLTPTVDDVKGMDVVSNEGVGLGEIGDVVLSTDDNQAYVTITTGGFLGIGEDRVIVPLSEVQFHEDQAVVNITDRTELRQRPAYEPEFYEPVNEEEMINNLQ